MSSPLLPLTVLQPQSCDGCGLCCHGVGSPVLLYVTGSHSDTPQSFRPEGLPEELIAEIDELFGGLYRGQEPQEVCIWFDPATRGCKHYEWRPQMCRDYEMGCDHCLIVRQEYFTEHGLQPLPA